MTAAPHAKAVGVECPSCGAPCQREVMIRGGDYGWSTTDEQRARYTYAPPALTAAEVEALKRVEAWGACEVGSYISHAEANTIAKAIRRLTNMDRSKEHTHAD